MIFTEEERAAKIESLQNGDCIFCDRTGLRNTVMHINKVHGIFTRDLREMLSVSLSHRLCPQEYADQAKKLAQISFEKYGQFNSARERRRPPTAAVARTSARERQEALLSKTMQEFSIRFHESKSTDHHWSPSEGDQRLTYITKTEGRRVCLICFVRNRYEHPSILQAVDLIAELAQYSEAS